MEILTQEQIKKLSIEETREIHNQFVKEYLPPERTYEQDEFIRNLKYHFQELGGEIKKTPYQRYNNKSEPASKKSRQYDDFDFKPKENKHKQKPINDQFLPLEYEKFFNNEELMKKIGNKTGLLLILLKEIVDWNKKERLNLYQEYFLKRKLLVASISRPRLAEMFGREKRRITAWTKELEKDGLLKIERITCMDDDDHRKKYNVYILGEVDDDGNKTFYYEK